MSKTIINADNSFVTFYNLVNDQGAEYFITDTSCGIQKDFCYPVYDEKDIAFQVNVASDEVLDSSNIIVNKVIDGTGVQVFDFVLDVEVVGTYGGSIPIYNIYVNFTGSDLTNAMSDGDCFQLSLVLGTIEVSLLYMVSNQCFKKISDKCLTSQLRYINNSDAFGFYYRSYGTFPNIGFTQNIIRLPIYFKEPNNPSNKIVYDRSNSVRQLLSARINKTYKGMIDCVTEAVHQKLVIALNHNDVRFVPEEYPDTTGFACRFEDEYNNEFPTVMQNVNVWPADFTIFVTPFNNFNSNCG